MRPEGREAAAPSIRLVAGLLFTSGLCALVYQTVWFRAFRLVFGVSTASNAAVLALFMAGLGLGSVVLGRRAERDPRPLGFYGRLELGIALCAAASPFLVPLVHQLYASLGGNTSLGMGLGTLVRLALAAPIVGIPAFLMGGTLPAAARAVEAGLGRRRSGLLYGANTLGALCGVVVTTFWALEHLGMRKTALVAALVNVLVAMLARRAAAALPELGAADDPAPTPAHGDHRSGRQTRILLAVATVSGFAFFLLEIVWYRMLAPLLGGSTYTFGLILALALLGIGLGGLAYGRTRLVASATTLTVTLLVEGLVVLLPLAAGDQLALVALALRTWGSAGFLETVLSWTVVASVVVLPAATVAGYQFPLLVATLGAGRAGVAREIGLAYGWNTGGAIVGSLAGGFGMLPLVGAPMLWRATGLLLVATGVVLWLLQARPRKGSLTVLATAAAAVACAVAVGPTAAWRHSGIGYGRFSGSTDSPNQLRRGFEDTRRAIVWEAEGLESSVALHAASGYSFFINGKSDGHALGDAATQVLSCLIPSALLSQVPRSALVIGLGTGSTAGWLAAVEGVERVDVVELEPAVLEVARVCAPVNHDALADPKVSISIGDAREVLLTTPHRYDLIFSEPSNPYRAGIASLFSVDFYRAVDERLAEGGVLVQWLQGYEIDPDAVRTVYATLYEVFPAIETWQVGAADLLLIASREPLRYDLEQLRATLDREPWKSAFEWTWGVEGLEGLATGYIGGTDLARAIATSPLATINTDDRSVLEFGFARNLGRLHLFSTQDLDRARAALPDADDPFAALDAGRIREIRTGRTLVDKGTLATRDDPSERDLGASIRHHARLLYRDGRAEEALEQWTTQDQAPMSTWDRLLVAEGLAVRGSETAPLAIAQLLPLRAAEAALLTARLELTRGNPDAAFAAWVNAVEVLSTRPWVSRPVTGRLLTTLTSELIQVKPELATSIWRRLSTPLAVRAFDEDRLLLRARVALSADFSALCRESLAPFEPHPPWELAILQMRVRCYEKTAPELEVRARADLAEFRQADPLPISESLGALGPPPQ